MKQTVHYEVANIITLILVKFPPQVLCISFRKKLTKGGCTWGLRGLSVRPFSEHIQAKLLEYRIYVITAKFMEPSSMGRFLSSAQSRHPKWPRSQINQVNEDHKLKASNNRWEPISNITWIRLIFYYTLTQIEREREKTPKTGNRNSTYKMFYVVRLPVNRLKGISIVVRFWSIAWFLVISIDCLSKVIYTENCAGRRWRRRQIRDWYKWRVNTNWLSRLCTDECQDPFWWVSHKLREWVS